METAWVSDFVRTVGVPVAALLGLSYAVWGIIRWVGAEVIIPIRDKLIGKAVAVMDQMSTTLATMSASLERIEKLASRFECRIEDPRRKDHP